MSIFLKGNKEGAHQAVEAKGIAIIVDTLRASTTIPVIMNKGSEIVYVAKEVEDTRLAARELNTIMMGERGCLKLEGFQFGNSPTEIYKLNQFPNKSVVFTSSTGARITIEAIGAKFIIIGSPINAKAVVQKTKQIINNSEEGIPVIIVPTFTEGSIISNEITEDQLGGLVIAQEFSKAGFELDSKIIEELESLENLLQKNTFEQLLVNTKHGQKLIELGFKHDIEFCSRINFVKEVPLSNNQIYTLENGTKIVKFEK